MPTARIFINHPKVGTVIVRKSRPHFKSKRFAELNKFVAMLKQYGLIDRWVFTECVYCKKSLTNPHSVLMHYGNGCEARKNKVHEKSIGRGVA